MAIKQQIDKDLKTAMLSGDKTLTTTLRGLKSAILYVEVAKGSRDKGLTDEEITDVLSKEAKKRSESAELYERGGNHERGQAELDEKTVIEKYLPDQLSEAEIDKLIDEVAKEVGEPSPQNLGVLIGKVKQKAGASADGSIVARLVKGRLK